MGIRGVHVKPGTNDAVRVVYVEDTVEDLQAAIGGGHFEVVPLPGVANVVILCDDEGKLKGLQPSFWWENDMICGEALILGVDGDEFRGLTPIETGMALNYVITNRIYQGGKR